MKKISIFNSLAAAAFVVKYEKRKNRALTQDRLMALMYIVQAYCCYICKEEFFTASICVSYLNSTFSIQNVSYMLYPYKGLYGTAGIRFYPPPLKKRRTIKTILNVCGKYTTTELYQKILKEPFFKTTDKRIFITNKMMLGYYKFNSIEFVLLEK